MKIKVKYENYNENKDPITVEIDVPDGTSEAFLRRIIGEGIPPLFVKKVFENLKQER